MRILKRFLERLAVLGLGIVAVWLIVFVFRITDRRLPTILSLCVAYMLAAYVILPRIVRMSLKILQRKSVPSFTLTGDGLPGDPVNLVLIGELDKLRAAFVAAGWTEADPLGLKSSWRMVVAFVLNRPYPAAPFSTLFLFGRGQDVGFQKAINDSPRKRHHIRFWALSLEQTEETLGTAEFWLNTDRPADEAAALWVGAATKDTGMSFTRFTFKVTHKTDSDTNAERDLIVSELKRVGAIDERHILPGRPEPRGRTRQPLRHRRRSRRGQPRLRLGTRSPMRDKGLVVRRMTEADLALALDGQVRPKPGGSPAKDPGSGAKKSGTGKEIRKGIKGKPFRGLGLFNGLRRSAAKTLPAFSRRRSSRRLVRRQDHISVVSDNRKKKSRSYRVGCW